MYNKIYHDNCLNKLMDFKSNSIDLIVADPPYFLSNGGKTINNGKIVSVDKGEWDKKSSKEEQIIFTETWIKECKRIVKNTGSIFITGTHHNIFDVYNVCCKNDLKLINFITWNKVDPPPLIYKNKFRFSSEHILWIKKGKHHKFNYQTIYKIENKEMTDVWKLNAVNMSEKSCGYHPTQKPLKLIERMVLACTDEGDIVLDPFMGSGTTMVAAKKLNRRYVGIEQEVEYFNIAEKRIQSTKVAKR